MNIEAIALDIAKKNWEKETGEPYEGSGYEISVIEMTSDVKRMQYRIIFNHSTKRKIQLNLAF